MWNWEFQDLLSKFFLSTNNQRCWNDETWDDFFFYATSTGRVVLKQLVYFLVVRNGEIFSRVEADGCWNSNWEFLCHDARCLLLCSWVSQMPKLGCSIMIRVSKKKCIPCPLKKLAYKNSIHFKVLLKKGGICQFLFGSLPRIHLFHRLLWFLYLCHENILRFPTSHTGSDGELVDSAVAQRCMYRHTSKNAYGLRVSTYSNVIFMYMDVSKK